MVMMRRLACLILLAIVAGGPVLADPLPWRRAISDSDRKRLAGLYRAWSVARSQVVAGGAASAWTAEGPLTDAFGTTADPPPPPGRYRCRTLKLGTRTAGMPVWTPTATTPCRIEASGEQLRFIRSGDGQRTGGLLYPDGDRLVYLGALSLANERSMFVYNADEDRNQVGVLRALGPKRWRLELPFPKWESTLDVVEITPAAP